MAQWVHQNNILLFIGFIFLGGFGLLTWFNYWTRIRFFTWLGSLLIASAALYWFQTPAATISEINQISSEAETQPEVSRTFLELNTIEEIEAYLAADDKPTLVEFYSDFGFS